MSAPVTTLDGLADGTELAVRLNGAVGRWVVEGDGLRLDEHTWLETFFFTGCLTEGLVTRYEARPPTVGEWFRSGTVWYLVVADEGENVFRTAIFSPEFDHFVTRSTDTLIWSMERERPSWDSPQLLAMTLRTWTAERRVGELTEKVNHQRRINQHADFIVRYATSIKEMSR